MECPKCGYERTARDLGNPGECPSCGIIYAKYEDREGPESYFPPAKEEVRQRRRGTGRKAVLWALALLCLAGGYVWLKHKPPGPSATLEGVDNDRVILLSTKWCGYCKLARKFLEKNNVAFLELDVESSEEGQRLFSKLNGKGVPVILIGDTRLDGYSEQALRNALVKEGLL